MNTWKIVGIVVGTIVVTLALVNVIQNMNDKPISETVTLATPPPMPTTPEATTAPEPPRAPQKTEAQIRQEVLEEQARAEGQYNRDRTLESRTPKDYLAITDTVYRWRPAYKSSFEGKIQNRAKYTAYKNIMVQVKWIRQNGLTKTGVVYLPITVQPGEQIDFLIDEEKPADVVTEVVLISRAKVVDTDNF